MLQLLREDPDHVEGLRFLANLYREKSRYAPALTVLKRLYSLNPQDVDAQTKLDPLLKRW